MVWGFLWLISMSPVVVGREQAELNPLEGDVTGEKIKALILNELVYGL